MTMLTNFRGLVLGTLCAFGATAGLAQDLKPVSVATSTTGMLYLPIYVADTMGYFEDEGLKVTTQTMKSSAIMAAVIGGDVDIYPGTPSAGLRAASQGTDIRIFGTLLDQYASNMVITGEKAKELGLTADSTLDERIAALKGLTIAVTGAGSGTHQLALYLLKRGGMNPDRDATIMFIGGSREILAAFENDRIDGFILSNPTSDTAVMDMDGFLMFDMVNGAIEELNGYPYITLDAREAWLKEDPARATAFVTAIAKAQQAIRDPERGHEVRDKVYAAHLEQFDKKLFDAAWDNMALAYPETPVITEAMLNKAIDYLNDFSEEKYDASLAREALAGEYTADIAAN
ncbi:ABC transporter substrate-binding protein [Frigidibacter sp. MR17.24]|uniref:ABC transporter substrate-binding protein n=1 Tax=Frigidibacter sp. MR17.24 TaxID=3127345 RepID=UPI003012C161